MLSSTEMQAFVKKINLTLFNDLFAFILDTAKADHELQWNICHSCILADVRRKPVSCTWASCWKDMRSGSVCRRLTSGL